MKLSLTLRTVLLAGATLAAGTTWAQQTLVPAQSSIAFTAKQLGVPLKGHFQKFDAQVQFSTAKPQDSKVQFTIDTDSATLGSQEADSNLLNASWLHSAKFPKATFESEQVKALGSGKYQIDGALTIKGQKHPVSVPVQLTQSGGTTTATGSFTLQRLPFQIGDGEWADTTMVANDVQVQFKLGLTGVDPL